jgi:hypothetical protein
MDLQLTEKQRAAVLRFGDPESDPEVIAVEVLEELMSLGLVHKRSSDGKLDFTDLGESVYDELSGQ